MISVEKRRANLYESPPKFVFSARPSEAPGACLSSVDLLCHRTVSHQLLDQIATDGSVEIPVVMWSETEDSHRAAGSLTPAPTPSAATTEATAMLQPAPLSDGIVITPWKC